MSEKTPKSNNLRKLPADAAVMNWEEAQAERFEEIASTTCGGRTNFNRKVTSTAQEKYGGSMQSVRVITSESEIAIYVVVGGPIPPDAKKGEHIPMTYDKKTGTSFTLPLYKPLQKLGIKVSKGRICKSPISVEEVENTGVCIILDVKNKEIEASSRATKADQQGKDKAGAEEQKKSTAASAKMDKAQELK